MHCMRLTNCWLQREFVTSDVPSEVLLPGGTDVGFSDNYVSVAVWTADFKELFGL